MGYTPAETTDLQKKHQLVYNQRKRAKLTDDKLTPVVLFILLDDAAENFTCKMVTHPNCSAVTCSEHDLQIITNTDGISPNPVHNVCIVGANSLMKADVRTPSCRRNLWEIDYGTHINQLNVDRFYTHQLALKNNHDNCWYSNDPNHAIGLEFINQWRNLGISRNEATVQRCAPKVYFASRSNVLNLLNSPKGAFFQFFMKNHVDFIFNCSGINVDYFKFNKLSVALKRFHYATRTQVYPPLCLVEIFRDKFDMKRIVGDRGLPYVEVLFPIEDFTTKDKGRAKWNKLSLNDLYNLYKSQFYDDVGGVKEKYVKGIVLKPRYGKESWNIIMYHPEERDGIATSNMITTYSGSFGEIENPEYISSFIPWETEKGMVLIQEYYIEPYLASRETRFFLTPHVGSRKGLRVIYNGSIDVDIQTGHYSDDPDNLRMHDQLDSDIQVAFGKSPQNGVPLTFTNILLNEFGEDSNWPIFSPGIIYRVDIFQNYNQDRKYEMKHEPNRKWFINEVGLVPIEHSFIKNADEGRGSSKQGKLVEEVAKCYAEFVKKWHNIAAP